MGPYLPEAFLAIGAMLKNIVVLLYLLPSCEFSYPSTTFQIIEVFFANFHMFLTLIVTLENKACTMAVSVTRERTQRPVTLCMAIVLVQAAEA
jgi:hypothetical protein